MNRENNNTDRLFQSLAEHSPDIITILDENLNYIYLNPTIEKYTGVAPKEFVGKSIKTIFHSKTNIEKILVLVDEVRQTGTPKEDETIIESALGEKKFFSLKVFPEKKEDSRVKNFFLVSRDITEMKNKQNILEENINLLRTSAEALLQPFVILSPVKSDDNTVIDFKYRYINNATVEYNEISKRDTIGKTVLELFPNHKENGVFDALVSVYKTGNSWKDTISYSGNAGSKFMNGEFIMSASKIDDGLVVTWEDMTKLKNIELKLKNSEKRFSIIFHNTPVAMILSKIDGEIIDVNKAYENLFGYSREELVGHKTTDFKIYMEVKDREEIIQKLNAENRIVGYELKFTNKNDEIIYALFNVVSTSIDGSDWYLSAIMDITNIKELEKSLTHSLEEKNTLLKEVHHRVKNNLQLIMSLLNLQKSMEETGLLKEHFQSAQARIRAMALVHEKLYKKDISKIFMDNYLNDLIEDIQASYEFGRNVKINTDIESLEINIDEAIKIGLLINEIITNSFKYAFPNGRDGEIKVEIKKIKTYSLEINISDNGIGLPEDFNERRKHSIGFQLLETLIDEMDGTYTLKSTPGCCFSINIITSSLV